MRKIKVGLYDNNCGHQVTRIFESSPEIKAIPFASCNCPDAEKYEGIRVYDTLDQMIADSDVELISLCSPNRRLQAAEAIKCMQAGKHVYAEKPCAMTERELDEIMNASEKYGVEFHEMAGSAFDQPFFALRELVLSGKLGEIVQMYTQKSYPLNLHKRPHDENIDGGLLMQVGVHNARFTEHITGLKITDIYAVDTKLGNNVENSELRTAVSYMMKLENGGIASAVANYLNFPKAIGRHGNECVRVFGTKGYAEITDAGRKSQVIIDNENLGPLDTSAKPKNYFEYFIDSLLGLDKMPLSLEDELHPTRMVIRASQNIL